jgi:hypothetical protein
MAVIEGASIPATCAAVKGGGAARLPADRTNRHYAGVVHPDLVNVYEISVVFWNKAMTRGVYGY